MVKKPSKKKRAKTSSKKTKPPSTSKIVKREPTPAVILKKVAAVSDSTNGLQREIKAMSKIFGDNQKVLVSMKGMIDTLTSTLENIQKQSNRLNIIEDDTQKLYSGLNQVRTQSNLITKINDQTTKLQDEVNKINQIQKASPKPGELSRQDLTAVMVNIGETTNDEGEVIGKNPVWIFPTESTNLLRIENDVDSMITSIDKISTVPKDSSAYHTGMLDMNDRATLLKENIMDATPYMYVSISNIVFSTMWIAVIIGIFAVLKRKKDQLATIDEASGV